MEKKSPTPRTVRSRMATTAGGDLEFRAAVNKAYEESWRLINMNSGPETGWTSAKTATLACDHVDKVEYLRQRTGGSHRKSSGKVFRVTATLPGPVEKVAALIRDVNSVASWNRTLQAARIVKQLERDMVITYQMTASNRSFIYPRDFVFGVKFGYVDGCFVAGGCSLDYSGPGCDQAPNDMVRATLWPSAMVARPIPGRPSACTFQWLLDCDYGGWVPKLVLDMALPLSQVLLVDSLARALESVQKKSKTKKDLEK